MSQKHAAILGAIVIVIMIAIILVFGNLSCDNDDGSGEPVPPIATSPPSTVIETTITIAPTTTVIEMPEAPPAERVVEEPTYTG